MLAMEKSAYATNEVHYSLDQGKSWKRIYIRTPIFPTSVLTNTDGISRKIIVSRTSISSDSLLIIFDFSNAYDGAICQENSFEEYHARQIGDKNSPLCIYGHREKFLRRKQNATCFVNKLVEDVTVIQEPCQCTHLDFECAAGFKMSPKDQYICIPDQNQLVKICNESNQEIKLDDKVLIEGNNCELREKKLSDFIVNQSIDCSKYKKEQDISVTVSNFEGDLVRYSMIEQRRVDNFDIVVQTTENNIYVSKSGFGPFAKAPIAGEILGFYTNAAKQAVIVTSELLYISGDDGINFIEKKVPVPPHSKSPRSIVFDPHGRGFIWFGQEENCKQTRDCEVAAYYITDSRAKFNRLPMENLQTCDFIGIKYHRVSLIICSALNSDNTKKLVTWSVNSDREPKVIFPHIIGYDLTSNFLVATTVNHKGDPENITIQDKVISDGHKYFDINKVFDADNFVDLNFPHDFRVDSQQQYTFLESRTKSIFKYVTTSIETNFEYGSILKSNSNGVSYVLVLDAVNRNHQGDVDYERTEDGLKGVIISNIVANTDDKDKKVKLLQTVISHNDGGKWNFLSAPDTDSNNQTYKCQGPKCHLHLHGPTERTQYRDNYSSEPAKGVLIRAGNVGEYLLGYDKASIFMSKDAGVSWKEIKKGNYFWEYGDHGTILVLVKKQEETDILFYSSDEGETWIEYKFSSEEKVKVVDLTEVPSYNSRKFLIFAKGGNKSETLAFSLDFTSIHSRQCQLDPHNPEGDDFEYWTPINPNSEGGPGCPFGKEVKYLRRAKGHHDCFIGKAPFKKRTKIVRKCTCTPSDYECDYNYYRNITSNTCSLVQGATRNDMKKEMCNRRNAFEYYIPTGYRKISGCSCQYGVRLDNANRLPCPGMRKEFNDHYETGFKLFLVIFIPIVVFFLVVWFVYDRVIRRNGGFKRFGQIQLGDNGDGFVPENNKADAIVNSTVKGVIFITGTITLVCSNVLTKIDKILGRMTSVFFAQETSNDVHMASRLPEEEEFLRDYDGADVESEDDAMLNEQTDVESEDDAILNEQTFADDNSIDIDHQQQQQ
ncbi:Vacuolar protein sorting/targeting protein 10 [Spathaspora sp. JA1]|nr:Vacuolar protein sorting/targeting protein 10 [Spathaspora sp. JA1]